MELCWHPYRYYPYERELAFREVRALISPSLMTETKRGIQLECSINAKTTERLVYFKELQNGKQSWQTLQGRLERVNGNGHNRQSTRYSVHGLHEYKGKFNPQIARAILNVLKVPFGARVLDPFCGSGTALVECSHLGMKAVGTDINPLAVFIANAKLSALQLSPSQIREELAASIIRSNSLSLAKTTEDAERTKYLQGWFDLVVLKQIEQLRIAIEASGSESAPLLLSLASNLLRDYSQQDPHDLRIRRRKSPLPAIPFLKAFEQAANTFLLRLEDAKLALEKLPVTGKALLLDSRSIKLGSGGLSRVKFDCALTSPPYATALPYIDTQRLSLVWLGLLPPSEILRLDAHLVGSREVRGERKQTLLSVFEKNSRDLPITQFNYCRMLQTALKEKDGFRRQAVPLLLYRYFSDMADVFRSVHSCMKDGAPFALIVGSNHTVLGGHRFDIDTPQHLTQIAIDCGWTHEETVPLQTYQRYGYHMNNAVISEGLIILRAM
jgi:hypothetical protein